MSKKDDFKPTLLTNAIPGIRELLENNDDWTKLTNNDFDRQAKWGGLKKNQIISLLKAKDAHLTTLSKLAAGLGVSFGTLLGLGDWEINMAGLPQRIIEVVGPIKTSQKISISTGMGTGFLSNLKGSYGNCLLSSIERLVNGFDKPAKEFLAYRD
jgi:hypothetical protein